MSFWSGAAGSLIGGGLSLAGSFLGPGQKSPRDLMWESAKLGRQEHNYYVKRAGQDVRRLARDAGVSPLVALGQTPHSGRVSVPSGSTASGNIYGDALGQIGQGLGKMFDGQQKRAMARQQMAAGALSLKEQEARIGAQSAAAFKDISTARTMLADARSRSAIAALERNPGAQAERRTLEMPSTARKFRVGTSAPAEDFEREYGDIASMIYGAWRFIDDMVDQPRVKQTFNRPVTVSPPVDYYGTP